MPDPPPLRRGHFVNVTLDGRTVPAMVVVASGNAHSIAVMFDALLGGYAGMMPVLWVDDHYEDLVERRRIEVRLRCREYRPDHNGECLNCDEPADAHG